MTCQKSAQLPGRKYAPTTLGRVLILGLGKTGQAVCDYCAELLGERVEDIVVAAGEANAESVAYAGAMRKKDIDFRFNWYTPEKHFDVCIASPGIAEQSDFYHRAQRASTEIISEVEFAWRESNAQTRWIAVTGTNGKTTTTALCAHILKAAGLKAVAVGNIGDTCIEAVGVGDIDYYVAEVSSYQLASTSFFAPDIAVILNITPDHIRWHGSFEAYRDAKLKVLANLSKTPDALAVLDATDDTVRAEVRRLKALGEGGRGFSYIPIGAASGLGADMRRVCGSENAAFISDGEMIVSLKGKTVNVGRFADLQIKGRHNASNALASAAIACSVGLDAEAITTGLSSFEPLEHRIEPCGTVAGIRCYNDSKATNVEAAISALESFGNQKIVALFGGKDKGTSLDDLVTSSEQHCAAVVCYGEAGPRIQAALSTSSLPVACVHTMEEALDCALGMAKPEQVLVLTPACASFDEFTSFEHRGQVFKELVAQRGRRVKRR